MYQNRMKRALRCFPNEWWANEEWRDELDQYWKEKENGDKDPFSFYNDPDTELFEQMDEDEIDVYLAMHSCVPDQIQKDSSRMIEFRKKAKHDGLLAGCIAGAVYDIPVEEWVEKKQWTLKAQIDDLNTDPIYEDSKELDSLFSDIDWITDSIADHAYNCSEVIDLAKKLCEDFAKLPQEQQIRFAVKILVADALKRRPLREEQVKEATGKLKQKLEQLEATLKESTAAHSEPEQLSF